MILNKILFFLELTKYPLVIPFSSLTIRVSRTKPKLEKNFSKSISVHYTRKRIK